MFSYVYDVNGIRSSKTVNGLKTNYYIYNAMILAEERLDASGNVDTFIYYLYDESGIAGMIVYDGNVGSQNGAYYYFTKNLFGDIIGIKNAANELVASYTYNAWGECTVKTNIDGIANLNPFRYRGYYYDTETGFYYLQTRYYDPEICRFISADDPEILGDLASVVGQLNLYAYCLNNPVMYTDPSGYSVTVALIVSMAIVTLIGTTLAAIDGGLCAQASGGDFWIGFGAGAASGFLGSLISSFSLMWPVFSVPIVGLGRLVSSGLYGIFNEWWQTGSLDNMNWGWFAFDVATDVFLSMLFASVSGSTGFDLKQTILSNVADSTVDVFQTLSYEYAKATNFAKNSHKQPLSFSVKSLYIVGYGGRYE